MERSRVVVVNLVPALLIVLAVVALWSFFGLARDVVLLLLLALLVSAALLPVVVWAHRRLGVPRPLGAILIVLLFLLVLAGAGWLLLPPVATQVQDFLRGLPERVDSAEGALGGWVSRYPALDSLLQQNPFRNLGEQFVASAQSLFSQAVSVAATVVRLVAGFVVVLVLVIYTLARPTPLLRGLLAVVPADQRERAERALKLIVRRLGKWALATFGLMLVVGLLFGLGLWLLGVENALLYGVLAALGELVPTIGAIVTTALPVLVTLVQDPGTAIWVLLLGIVVQQLEANVLTPLVFGESVNLHPVAVLSGVLVFGSVFGLIGAFLTVPFLIVLKTLIEVFYLPSREPVPDGEARRALGDSR